MRRTIPMLLLCLLAAGAWGQAVSDGGKYFSADAVKNAESQIAALEKAGVRAKVETTQSAPGGQTTADQLRVYAEGKAKSETLDLLIYANREPRALYVVAPSGSKVSSAMRKSIADAMLARFKESNFDAGLSEGLTIATASGNLSTGPRTQSQPRRDDRSGSTNSPANSNNPVSKTVGLCGNLGCFGIAILVIGAFIVLKLLGSVFGNRSRGGGGGYGQGFGGGYNTPGYGGGGGGFGAGLGGGLLGGILGNMIGGRMFGNQSHHDSGSGYTPTNDPPTFGNDSSGGGYDSGSSDISSGGDYGGGDSGGGGGDSGGGDSSGGSY